MYTVPVREAYSSVFVLEDVSPQGLLLINELGLHGPGEAQPPTDPKLILWDIERRKVATEIPLPDWVKWNDQVPGQVAGRRVEPLRFLRKRNQIVGLLCPWLLLVDVAHKSVVARWLLAEEYLDPRISAPPFPRESVQFPYRDLALNPLDDSVAVALNLGRKPRVFIVDAHSGERLATWTLPRWMQRIAWSPDGNKLAVLFSAQYDENGRDVWMKYAETSALSDLWIYDARSGKVVKKIVTGSFQTDIVFSPLGDLIYTVNTAFYWGHPKGAIRAFSVTTGERVREIVGPKEGFKNSLAVSPDGKWVAGDASAHVPQGLHLERIAMLKIARILILNAESGRIVFEEHQETAREDYEPLRFMFSPDQRFFLVDYPWSKRDPYEHIDVYSFQEMQEPARR